jgi:23S rRNA pseudouridine1911/1915/1917 synthase
VQKIYLAVVANLPPEPAGTLEHYVTKNGQINRSIASEEASEDAQLATLKYRHIASSERYHLLEIELITGRHHQIRAQLAAAGCPIKGDVKYGARRSNRDRSIHLHAWQLKFLHPVSNEKVTIVAPFPVDPVWQAFEDLNLEV